MTTRSVKNTKHKLNVLKRRHAAERRIKRMEAKLDKREAYLKRLLAKIEAETAAKVAELTAVNE